MRSRSGRFLGAACFTFALLATYAAEAQYVLYNTSHGAWAVTCWRELLSRHTSCAIKTPLPTLGAAGRGPTVTISPPPDADGMQVELRIPGVVDARENVTLAVDEADPATAPANRYGEAGWRGEDARTLIERMRLGDRLRLEWKLEGENVPRTAAFPLGGFAAALDDYRMRLETFGTTPK